MSHIFMKHLLEKKASIMSLRTIALLNCISTFSNVRCHYCPSLFLKIRKHYLECFAKRFFNNGVVMHVKRKYPILPEKAESLPVFKYPTSKETDRRVYVWGLAEHGALGNHNQFQKSNKVKSFFYRPVRLHFAEKHQVSDITCGYGFTAFAVKSKEKNKVYGCGINTDSQIGRHAIRRGHPLDIIVTPLPIHIPFNDASKVKVTALSAGRAHLLVLTDSEGVYSLGNNAYGQCGRRIVDNEDYSSGSIIHNIPCIDGHKIEKVVCGQDHSIFITDCGTVYACGWGADGQTGSGHYENSSTVSKVVGDIEGEKIVKVAGSVDCVLALNEKGEIFGWGNSEYGQLLTSCGNVQQNKAVFLSKTASLGKFVDIAAGGSFCIAVNDKGDVYVWGYGILGKGPNVDQASEPTLIPHTLFGRNEFDPSSTVVNVNAGLSHLAAITNTGNLFTWGRNRGACLGLGHEDDQYFPLRVAVGATVMKVSCGVDHTVTICKSFV